MGSINFRYGVQVMGMLVDGQWQEGSVLRSDGDGDYDRQPRSFRDTVSPDHEKFTPDSGRYHLYVSYACPWATRTLIYRRLKGLVEHIGISVVHPEMLADGWHFDKNFPDATVDHLFNSQYLREIYLKADPNITTSVTVPILWDTKHSTIVNNESAEIIRIFNTGFNSLTGNDVDYYPSEARAAIDRWNDKIYETVNNGVYRAGFAKTQDAYDKAVSALFATLDEIESQLKSQQFLVGESLSEADLRLIPTLLRFDSVYATHFKCNRRRIQDYPQLSSYTRRLYEVPAVRESTFFDHIKRHYYYSHEDINPFRIVPAGPDVLF